MSRAGRVISILAGRWQADRIGDEFILRPGPTGPPSQQAGNVERGWSPGSVMTMNPSSLDRQSRIISGLSGL